MAKQPNDAPTLRHQEEEPDVLRHSPGCPMKPDRTEMTRTRSPSGRWITVARCLDCAAHIVLDTDGSRFITEDSLALQGDDYARESKGRRG